MGHLRAIFGVTKSIEGCPLWSGDSECCLSNSDIWGMQCFCSVVSKMVSEHAQPCSSVDCAYTYTCIFQIKANNQKKKKFKKRQENSYLQSPSFHGEIAGSLFLGKVIFFGSIGSLKGAKITFFCLGGLSKPYPLLVGLYTYKSQKLDYDYISLSLVTIVIYFFNLKYYFKNTSFTFVSNFINYKKKTMKPSLSIKRLLYMLKTTFM